VSRAPLSDSFGVAVAWPDLAVSANCNNRNAELLNRSSRPPADIRPHKNRTFKLTAALPLTRLQTVCAAAICLSPGLP